MTANSPEKNEGFSRLMTRPAGRVTWCSKCHESDRVGSGSANLSGRVWSGQEFLNLTGRVRSGEEVGDEELTRWVRLRPARSGPVASRASMTRELFSADPQVGRAHPTLETFPALLPKCFSRTNA